MCKSLDEKMCEGDSVVKTWAMREGACCSHAVIGFVVESVRFEQNNVSSKLVDGLNVGSWSPLCFLCCLFVVKGIQTGVFLYKRTGDSHKSVL